MEPFGLLHFLKSTFPSMDESSVTPTLFPSENSLSESPEKAQKSTPPVEKSTERNAFTDFIAAHDERVKRIKR